MKNVNHLILGGAKGHVADMKHLRRCGLGSGLGSLLAVALLHNEPAAVQQVQPAVQRDVYMHVLMNAVLFIRATFIEQTQLTATTNKIEKMENKQVGAFN